MACRKSLTVLDRWSAPELLIRRSLVRVQVGEPEFSKIKKAQPLPVGLFCFHGCAESHSEVLLGSGLGFAAMAAVEGYHAVRLAAAPACCHLVGAADFTPSLLAAPQFFPTTSA